MKTKTSLRSLTLALALWPLAAVSSLHAQMVLNGSFENPALPNGDGAPGSGDNWTATGNAFLFTNGRNLGTTTFGNQWEILLKNDTDAQTLTGTFTLGSIYTLSLVAADVFATPGDLLTLSITGVATASQTFVIPQRTNSGNTPLPFVTYSLDFTPTTTGSVTITLTNASAIAGSDIALDNVQVGLASAVPEPSTWALLGLGGAGLLGVTLRHQRARLA